MTPVYKWEIVTFVDGNTQPRKIRALLVQYGWMYIHGWKDGANIHNSSIYQDHC